MAQDNTVIISGMFGNDKTYFAGSPVVIDISGLQWPVDDQGKPKSPFNVVEVDVIYNGNTVGFFREDTGGQTVATFDIQSALRALWADYDFTSEVSKAQMAVAGSSYSQERAMRAYSLMVYTEYMASDDGGVFTRTEFGPFDGGRCLLGSLTEWERYNIGAKENADALHWDRTNPRNGDASTKPTESPERVGATSITSWVDVRPGYTKSIFYPASATPEADDTSQSSWTGHAPIVLRDSQQYVDFLFVNRRGAVETCSGLTLEAMNLEVNNKPYARTERPSFKPSRSLMSVRQGDPRRSWPMSSGYQTREWAEWWTMEFLTSERHWMLYGGAYVPVIVEASKKSVGIYDRAKQQAPHVDFTVTLALEG